MMLSAGSLRRIRSSWRREWKRHSEPFRA